MEDTPKFDRLEITKSPTLCPPGPHAFLLVIPIDSAFPKIYRMALQGQGQEYFSEKIWGYTIVLFSSIATDNTITLKKELKIMARSHMASKKCQNRMHVLNIRNRNDSTQVTKLLEKIEKMVAQNNGNYFENTPVSDERVKITEERVKPRTVVGRKHGAVLQASIKGTPYNHFIYKWSKCPI